MNRKSYPENLNGRKDMGDFRTDDLKLKKSKNTLKTRNNTTKNKLLKRSIWSF